MASETSVKTTKVELPIDIDRDFYFVLDRPRYNQDTFYGRWKHFLDVTDVRTVFTPDTIIEQSKDIIAKYRQSGELPSGGEEALWAAIKVRDTCLHPDTNEKISPFLRIAGFVPANVILCGGMLIPNASPLTQVFWHWLNQSYNIGLNYANRNASHSITNIELGQNYAVAVGVSCGVALGLDRAFKKLPLAPKISHYGGLMVPFAAVALANIANVFMMRRNELIQGIHVKSEDGTVVGSSQIAGKYALSMVSGIRVTTSVPVMTMVPLIMNYASSTKFFMSNPRLSLPFQLTLIGVILLTALPCAVAMFPQTISISATRLEERFHGIKDREGKIVETLYFNRGL